jgi:hypothetical protein
MTKRGPLTMREGHDREQDDEYVRSLTPAERVAMAWSLSLQAWEFAGSDPERRLQRNVVVVKRRER